MLSEKKIIIIIVALAGLNPCFSGICSLRRKLIKKIEENPFVLILVLVEYAL